MNKYATTEASQRRDAILSIATKKRVSSQEELQGMMAAAGFEVTQPTLSRDIRELGLVKTPAGYVSVDKVATATEAAGSAGKLQKAITEFALSLEPAGNLVVIRTPPAAAHPLALAVDQAALPNVLGCIAGDDTIFVAFKSTSAATAFTRRFRESLSPRRPR